MTEQDRRRAIHQRLARMEHPEAAFIPTGWRALDAALGGGLPRGRVVELYGPSGSGKTTLALQLAAHVQQSGGSVAWIDAEHVFDPAYAARVGIAADCMPVAQPQTAEQAFAISERLAASQALDLLIVDSAAALVPLLELETPLGESGPGLQGRVMISGLRRLSQVLRRTTVAALFLNQTRGGEESSAGGPGLKLYAAVRIVLEPAGRAAVRFRLLKNKSGTPFASGELYWEDGRGFTEGP